MRKQILLTISAAATVLFMADSGHAKLNELQKENFFDFMLGNPQGRDFLSSVASRIMDRTQHHLLFNLASVRSNPMLGGIGSFLECQSCKLTVSGIDSTIRSQVVTQALEEFSILVCHQIETANNTVCPGAVTEMAEVIIPTLTNFILGPDYLCSRVLGMCDPVFRDLDQNEYINRVMSDKPEHLKTNDFVDKLYDSIKASGSPRKTFKAAHFSDVHVDLLYKEGTNANCNMPLCCRAENGIPADPKDAARKWGEYQCDTTHAVVTKMFEFLRDEIKPDVLFWTGDMSPHSVWENSDQEVADVNYVIAKQIQETFGEELMVYPLQGNHDVFPVNVQDFSGPQNYVIKNLTTVWNYWLDQEAIKTFGKAGYYTQYFELKSKANKKFFNNTRVLGVTTQTCNDMNWYLWEVLSDPGDELAWLEGVLRDMEAKGEQAILLGHIPTNDCLRAWGSRFQALADRFQHIIRFGLFGHSHDEKFFLTRSLGRYNESRPIAFNSILAPTTTYQGKNPSIAVYDIDEETMLPVNITTYFFNITKANVDGIPEWEVYHNILEAYGMPDASPNSFNQFAKKLLKDEQTAKDFNMWNAKGGPDGPMDSCGEDCRRGTYCQLVTSFADTQDECNAHEVSNDWKRQQKRRHDSHMFQRDMTRMFGFDQNTFYDFMTNPWLEKI